MDPSPTASNMAATHPSDIPAAVGRWIALIGDAAAAVEKYAESVNSVGVRVAPTAWKRIGELVAQIRSGCAEPTAVPKNLAEVFDLLDGGRGSKGCSTPDLTWPRTRTSSRSPGSP